MLYECMVQEFPSLRESTVRGWLSKYRAELKLKVRDYLIVISQKRGRPLFLPDELDMKLRTFITHLRTAGGSINRHVIFGVLMGLIKSDLVKFGQYLDFVVTDGWVQSLYKRMNFTRRMVTTSRPIVTKSLWIETRTQF